MSSPRLLTEESVTLTTTFNKRWNTTSCCVFQRTTLKTMCSLKVRIEIWTFSEPCTGSCKRQLGKADLDVWPNSWDLRALQSFIVVVLHYVTLCKCLFTLCPGLIYLFICIVFIYLHLRQICCLGRQRVLGVLIFLLEINSVLLRTPTLQTLCRSICSGAAEWRERSCTSAPTSLLHKMSEYLSHHAPTLLSSCWWSLLSDCSSLFSSLRLLCLLQASAL